MGAGRTARVERVGAAALSRRVALPVGGAAGDGGYVGKDPRGAGRITDDAVIAARVNARYVRGAPAR